MVRPRCSRNRGQTDNEASALVRYIRNLNNLYEEYLDKPNLNHRKEEIASLMAQGYDSFWE